MKNVRSPRGDFFDSHCISVLQTLQNFLSRKDVTSEVWKECRDVDANLLHSYRDGSAYKQSLLYSSDGMALRLHVYIDDFEVCNPIGSRRSIHKLTAVYYVVGNTGPKYWSQTSIILII